MCVCVCAHIVFQAYFIRNCVIKESSNLNSGYSATHLYDKQWKLSRSRNLYFHRVRQWNFNRCPICSLFYSPNYEIEIRVSIFFSVLYMLISMFTFVFQINTNLIYCALILKTVQYLLVKLIPLIYKISPHFNLFQTFL